MPTAALVRKLADLDPTLREVFLLLMEELEQQVTKTEFNELKAIVGELAEAQKKTEQRLDALAAAQERTEQRIGELAEAQKKTEQRLDALAAAQERTEQQLSELAAAQKKTEQRLDALAAAQERTEQRLTRLEEAIAELVEWQKKAEQRLTRLEEAIAELAEAQKRTEVELQKLVASHRVTRERLEGLSNTVGYTLEDRAFRSLPDLLRQHGIEVEGRLVRRYVLVRGRERQVNIYGHGRRAGKPVLILGEAKVRPSRKEVDRFLRLVKQLEAQEGQEAVPLFVAYDFPPRIEAYLREREVLPVWSYDLAL